MTTLVVHPAAKPLRGLLPAPPDHLTATVAIAAGLAIPNAETELTARGIPHLAILDAARQLGADAVLDQQGVRVRRGAALEPNALNADSCGLTAAALCGLFAGDRQKRTLCIDAGNPERLFEMASALRARGGSIEGHLDPDAPGALHSPLELGGGAGYIEAMQAVRRLNVKLALLMTCLQHPAPLVLQETPLGDDRPERVLAQAGIQFRGAGPVVQAMQGQQLQALSGTVPGDPASSSFLLAAALGCPGSVVGVRSVIANPAISAWLDELKRAGIALQRQAKSSHLGQATADLTLAYGPARRALVVGGESAQRSPLSSMAWAVFAAQAAPGTRSCLQQLPGSVEQTQALLKKFGVVHEAIEAGLVVEGCAKPRGCHIRAQSADAVMAACVLALRADGLSRIEGAEALVQRFPRFVASMRALGTSIEVETHS